MPCERNVVMREYEKHICTNKIITLYLVESWEYRRFTPLNSTITFLTKYEFIDIFINIFFNS